MFYTVPEYGTGQKLVLDCMTHVPEIGTSFSYRFMVHLSLALRCRP